MRGKRPANQIIVFLCNLHGLELECMDYLQAFQVY